MADVEISKIIVRGGQPMDPQQLPAHLGLALRLENVAVLLGSGASVSAGGKTMGQAWLDLRDTKPKIVEWLTKEKFVDNGDPPPTPNLEQVMSAIDLAVADALRRGGDTAEIIEMRDEIRRTVLGGAMLNAELWKARDSEKSRSALQPYLSLLTKLQASRQPGQSAPWVFTTNYDLAIEWAAELLGIHIVNGFSGLHDRQFQPNAFDLSLQNTRASGEARFGSYNLNLVKLHGSLAWRKSGSGDAIEVACGTVYEALNDFLSSKEKAELPSILVHPAAAKYFDTVGFIYGELIRRFTEFLSRPNTTLIICGYGFGDEHINRLLASGLLNPTLQVVIYYPDWDDMGSEPPNEFVRNVKSLGLPRVIIRGGGDAAHFDQFARDLPDPALVDELSADVSRMLQQLARANSTPPAGEGKA